MNATAPTAEEIAERLRVCMPRLTLGDDPLTRIADLNLDSMDTVELLCVIHEEFGNRLNEADFHPDQTVQALLSAVVRGLNNQN